MNIKNVFRRKIETKSYSLVELANLLNTGGSEIKENNAMEKISTVYTCVRRISEKMGSIPFTVVQNGKENKKVLQILSNPNPKITGEQLIQQIDIWWELRGEAFLWVKYPFFYVLDYDFVSWERNNLASPLPYDFYYTTKRGRTLIPQEELVILDNYNPYGRFPAMSTLTSSLPDLNLQGQSKTIMTNFFKNGAVVPLVLKSIRNLTDTQRENLHREWEGRYAGPGNAGKTPILEGDIDIKTIGLSFIDMGILEIANLTDTTIASVFGVPPLFLNSLKFTKYDSAGEQRKIFTEQTIIPRLTSLEGQLTQKLLPLLRGEGFKVDFDYEHLPELREDEEKASNIAIKYVQAGIRTINEIRDDKELPPVPWGDSWWGNISLTPLGTYTPEAPEKVVQELVAKMIQKLVEKVSGLEKKIDLGKAKMDKEKVWKAFIARTTPQEKRFKTEIRKLFEKQEKEALENLKAFSGSVTEKGLEEELIDFAKWEEVFAKTEMPFILAFMQQAGDQTVIDYGLAVDFDLQTPAMQKWIKKKVMKFAYEVNKTTREALKKTLAEGAREGEGTSLLSGRVANAFKQAKSYRTDRIARTEVIGANNKASLGAAEQNGVRKKIWVTAMDEVTRGQGESDEWNHIVADGEEVPLDKPFIKTGEELMFPGDPSGSPGNIINCRCTQIFGGE